VKRSQALDAVRGIAIILVLIWHYMPRTSVTPEFLITSSRLFWSGVDLFFVLSGFLIAGILLQNVQAENYFSTFYIRRAARIVPLYLIIFFLLVIVIALAPRLESEYLLRHVSGHLPLWSYLTFTQNFLYAARENMNDPFMDVTWSLAVEEQFYIALSLLIKKLSKKKLLILAIVLISVAPLLRIYAAESLAGAVLPLHRADALMCGVLLALVWQNEKAKQFLNKHVRAFRWSCFLLFLVLIYYTYWKPAFWDIPFLLALFYGNLILLVLLQSGKQNRFDPFQSRVLEWFGFRSYGIYLFHKPVLILAPFVLGWLLHRDFPTWTAVVLSLAVLVIVSEASYRLLEKPIMDWGHRFKYEQPPAGARAEYVAVVSQESLAKP
jgi:peptidoglycan/LPS O-acetylase OafA/YrhL